MDRTIARESSRLAYAAALRTLTDEQLTRELKILEHTPELREELGAEFDRRNGKAAAA